MASRAAADDVNVAASPAPPTGPPTALAADVFAGMQAPIPLDSAEAAAAMERIKAAEAAEAAGAASGSAGDGAGGEVGGLAAAEEELFAQAVAAAQAAKAAADTKAVRPGDGITQRVRPRRCSRCSRCRVTLAR